MICPECEYPDTSVLDSRVAEGGMAVRRRRECVKCGHRFTTYERSNQIGLIVTKNDGSAEQFNREKILRGLMIATAKRNISLARLNALIDEIERRLKREEVTEVSSKQLGNMVLELLIDIDEIAYIRFASVYKDFQTIDEFTDAL